MQQGFRPPLSCFASLPVARRRPGVPFNLHNLTNLLKYKLRLNDMDLLCLAPSSESKFLLLPLSNVAGINERADNCRLFRLLCSDFCPSLPYFAIFWLKTGIYRLSEPEKVLTTFVRSAMSIPCSGCLSDGEHEKGVCPESTQGRSEPLAFACGRHFSQRLR